MSSSEPGTPAGDDVEAPRQRVERMPGRRRARLTPAPGTTTEPAPVDDDAPIRESGTGASGPNDERMRRDVPPHY